MPGLYFEEFTVGQTFVHSIRRTVTEMDNVLITALTHNPAALHLDEEYCRTQTEFGRLGRGTLPAPGISRRYPARRKRSA